MAKSTFNVSLSKYKLQIKVGGKDCQSVNLGSDDFNKNSVPPIEKFNEFPFLKDDFRTYITESLNLKKKTAKSYSSDLIYLFNNLEFDNDNNDFARKCFLLLPWLFKKDNTNECDGDFGFKVLDFWMNKLNETILSLKQNHQNCKTFQNSRSALQAYINFLEEKRDVSSDVLYKNNESLKSANIDNFNRIYKGITIQVHGKDGFIETLLARMGTEDRYPTSTGAVYYPARILKQVLGGDFKDVATDCIQKILVYTENGTLELNKIGSIKIGKDGLTYAIPEDNNSEYLIYNDPSCTEPLKANSQADLSREHNPSIATILEREYEWKALKELTKIIINANGGRIPKQSEASKITQTVMNNRADNGLDDLSKGLLDDLKFIIENTKISLMQRSKNSSLNKHN